MCPRGAARASWHHRGRRLLVQRARGRPNLWAFKTSQNDIRSVVAGAGSGGFGASEKAPDPVWLPCKLRTRLQCFPSSLICCIQTHLCFGRKHEWSVCRVKGLFRPLILTLWCMHLWKEVMCTAAARTCICVCALSQANECGANGTEVIMWSVIALWFLPHRWAAFCHV